MGGAGSIMKQIMQSSSCTSPSEFNDVRLNLARTRNKGHYVPLKLFRAQKGSSLNVTDIHSSLWCEVQVEYKYMHRHLKSTPAWTQLEKQGKPVQLTTPAMKQGATMHLAKGNLNHFPKCFVTHVSFLCRIGGP